MDISFVGCSAFCAPIERSFRILFPLKGICFRLVNVSLNWSIKWRKYGTSESNHGIYSKPALVLTQTVNEDTVEYNYYQSVPPINRN